MWQKLGASANFWHTASPQVGSSSGSKLSKHYYGCKYDLRYITQSSTGNKNGLKCKLGPKCGENIQNLADEPSFYDTASPQVGSSSGSKLSKDYYRCRSELRYITQSTTGNENGLKCKLGPKCVENIQNLADAPNFYHTASPQSLR